MEKLVCVCVQCLASWHTSCITLFFLLSWTVALLARSYVSQLMQAAVFSLPPSFIILTLLLHAHTLRGFQQLITRCLWVCRKAFCTLQVFFVPVQFLSHFEYLYCSLLSSVYSKSLLFFLINTWHYTRMFCFKLFGNCLVGVKMHDVKLCYLWVLSDSTKEMGKNYRKLWRFSCLNDS